MEDVKKNGTTEVLVEVDPSRIVHTLKGGMGASWHAISKEIPLENKNYVQPARDIGPRGSAYGGNPPIEYTKAWNQLKHYATWLGFNFVRVELSHRMYEPERKVYDWDNVEMLALYQILDWAEENHVDVFLQQMWSYVAWNTIPGIHPLISAPKSLDDFAEGIATLLEYLQLEKGYTCIKYFCMTNEPPGGTWGYWWEAGNTKSTLPNAWKRLREELDNRDIQIPISGPDWTDMPPFDESKLGFAKYFGAIDIHSYHGISAEGEANLGKWAQWAHAQGKPFFLTEYGNMNLGWGGVDPNQKSFDAAISNACDVIRGLRAKVDAFNRWSYTNRGNLDGQWQLVQTFDIDGKEYLRDIRPEPEAFYGFGIISRFFPKYASTILCKTDQEDGKLLANALVSPKGNISIFLVNLEEVPLSVKIEFASPIHRILYVYQVSKELVSNPNFAFKSTQILEPPVIPSLHLPARSITTISSYLLASEDDGIIMD